MKSLGLDLHAASFTLAVLTAKGQLASSRSNHTTAENLIAMVDAVPGPKALIVEESHLAQWAKRTLERYVDAFLVCDPTRNDWIARADFNDDSNSAYKLAKLHQGGFLKPIHHPDSDDEQLRALFVHYYDLNQQLTRFKNKLKATFRQEAIPTAGKKIYVEEDHESWLRQLRRLPHLRHAASQRFKIVDTLEDLKEKTYEKMVKLARKKSAFALLDGLPGAGPVIVTGYLAMIETPHRFSRKNKLWSYAALGNRLQTSDDKVYDSRASKCGNRVLKWVVIEHFTHAVECARQSNRFKRKYDELCRKGVNPTAARRHVCRALLSTVRAMWMKGEAYRDNLLTN